MPPNGISVMRDFHVSLHARGEGVEVGRAVEISGCSVQTLNVPTGDLQRFAISFEQACDALQEIGDFYVELDGSFFWRQADWQIEGNLYDVGGRLLYVELRGYCPQQQFQRLLEAFGWPETKVLIQLVREGTYVELDEFRRLVGYI